MVRTLVCTLALAASTIAPLASNAMSIFHHSDNNPAASTNAPKGKTVKLTLKNRTDTAMTLTVNEQPMTLAANSESEIRAVEGTDVRDANNVVKLHVTRELGGTTVSFR